jgi:hypothetical protein
VFVSPDGKAPFLIGFRDDQAYFMLCVKGVEDPVAREEIPREFSETWSGGDYLGLALGPRRVSLQRYVSVILNTLRLGSCPAA